MEEHVEPKLDDKELTTVRDILFGAKTREHEQRFDELRTLWMSSLKEARGEFRERLEQFERETKKEVRTILDRIKLEHDAWQQRAAEVSQKLQDLHQDHENKLNELRAMEANQLKVHRETLTEWVKRLETVTGKIDKGNKK